MPRFSIVTPCYNAERFIERTIASIRAQTYQDWEHIVVDDGSTDRSMEVVQELANHDSRLRLIRQENQGCPRTRNNGFQNVSDESEFLFFLDADDCLEPSLLQEAVDYFDAHPAVGLFYCKAAFVDLDDQEIPDHLLDVGWAPRHVPKGLGLRELGDEEVVTPFESLFLIPGILPSVCLFRRSVYEKTPGWDELIGMVYEDVDLYWQMGLLSEVHYYPHKLVRYRRHPAQSSQKATNNIRLVQQEAKLYTRWSDLSRLPSDHGAILRRAWKFRVGRFLAINGFRKGTRHLRRREWKQGVVCCMGAARRYAASFCMPVEYLISLDVQRYQRNHIS